MSAATRKPWPMRWIVATILLFIVPYTYINLKFRKPGPAFEPYADMQAQANVKRLLEAGYTRVTVRAERPFPALPRADITRSAPPAASAPAPGGLPSPLDTVLVETPRLPESYRDLVAPAEFTTADSSRLQFTARYPGQHEQLGGAEVYLQDDSVVIVPTFERIPDGLQARTPDTNVLLTLPAGMLAPGRHRFTLAGTRDSVTWHVVVR
jgi:hypothetical protein